MPQVEVKTRMRFPKRKGVDPQVVVYIDFVPRGSGNRNMARRVAAYLRAHPKLGPHLVAVKSGTSRVTMTIRPSIEASRVFLEWQQDGLRERELREAGQLELGFT